MSLLELLDSAQFVVDAAGQKKLAQLDIAVWQELRQRLAELTSQFPPPETERQQARQVLRAAGLIQPRLPAEPIQPVSETELARAAHNLGQAGSLSELIIAERAGR